MFFLRLSLSIIIMLLCTSSIISASPEKNTIHTKSLLNIGLRNPIRLPIFYDDASTLRFVSRNTPLSDINYTPIDLISISGALINQAGRNSMLRRDARDALWNLADAFQSKYNIPLTVISGYRSAAYQQRLWDLGKCRDSLCAPPGYSEHQLGLAVDLFDATSESEFMTNPVYKKYVRWLRDNAHLYGWTQSYQKGAEIDEYDIEPWHYRYLGVTLATRLHNLGWTYTEFVRFQEAIQRK